MSNSDSRVVFQNVCANRCCHTRRKPEGSARTSASVGVRRREVICANPAGLQLARTANFHPKSGDESRETRGTRERKIVWTDSSTHPVGEARQFFHCLISRLFACFALAHSRFYIESCAGLSRNDAVGNGAACFKRRGAEGIWEFRRGKIYRTDHARAVSLHPSAILSPSLCASASET